MHRLYAGIHRGPTRAVAVATATHCRSATFYLLHLAIAQRSYDALYFQISECNFIFFHDTNEMVECESGVIFTANLTTLGHIASNKFLLKSGFKHIP